MEYVSGILHTFGCGHRCVLKSIGYAELLPFEASHHVIGQNIDAFDIRKCIEELAQTMQGFIVVSNAWHQYVTNPNRNAQFT